MAMGVTYRGQRYTVTTEVGLVALVAWLNFATTLVSWLLPGALEQASHQAATA